jgi:hypothetical protein
VNYFILWLNISGVIILAINYQSLFDYFQNSVLILLTIISSVVALLTGNKHLELKSSSFNQVFSSGKTWIPNIIILVVIIIIYIATILPTKQTILVHLDASELDSLETPFKINGSAMLYVRKNNVDSLIRTEPVTDTLITFNFEKPKDAYEYFVILKLKNEFNRFQLTPDSLTVGANFDDTTNCNDPKIELNKKFYTIKAPEHIGMIKFEDITEFGKTKLQQLKNGESNKLMNGQYEYTLYDGDSPVLFGKITINDKIDNDELILPKNSRRVKFIIPKGRLELKGKGFLGKVNIKSGQTLTLLDETDYEYVLSENYYWSQSKIISLKNADSDGCITIPLDESNRRKASVRFIAQLPDGDKVPADIYIDGNYLGKAGDQNQLKFDKYNDIRITYVDTLTSKGDRFIYEATLPNYIINENQINIARILELK